MAVRARIFVTCAHALSAPFLFLEKPRDAVQALGAIAFARTQRAPACKRYREGFLKKSLIALCRPNFMNSISRCVGNEITLPANLFSLGRNFTLRMNDIKSRGIAAC